MSEDVYILYANCIPVKGAKSCVIMDLQRSNYIYIPTDLYTILINHRGKSLNDIKQLYDNKYDEIIDTYFKTLLDNDFVFSTNTPELFPALNKEWMEPFLITNAIIDIAECSVYSLNEVIKQLSELYCKFVQIRHYNKIDLEKIDNLLHFLNEIQSNSVGIDVMLPYYSDLDNQACIDLFEKYDRLNSLVIFSSPIEKQIIPVGTSRFLIHTAASIGSEKDCGHVCKSMLVINPKMYTESLQYNSCLNRKVSIDKDGNIKNCPSMDFSFGNIETDKIKDIVVSDDFKSNWELSKDKIEVCPDCELRYMCTDCRAYTTKPGQNNSKPLKCGYDPYTGVWSDLIVNEISTESV